MKKYIIALILLVALCVQAQEVSTLYFLENAPMRHLVNPALQPVSKGYVNFTPLGYNSLWVGNNTTTLIDLVYTADNGSTVTALHPQYGNKAFFDKLPKTTTIRQDATLNWLGFGSRVKENGYFTFQVMEKIDSKEYVPSSIFSTLFNGGQLTPTSTATLNLGETSVNTQIYTEIGGGYSHKINDVWTVGGKLKVLLGSAYIGAELPQFELSGNAEALQIKGTANALVAGPLNFAAIPSQLTYQTFGLIDIETLLWAEEGDITKQLYKFFKPSGYGAAVDLGFTATPLKQLQISVGLNDLGFIYWNNAGQITASVDTTFTGVGPFNYNDYIRDGQFMADSLSAAALSQIEGLLNAVKMGGNPYKFCRMITTKLNVGVDGRFFDNRLTVGVLSKTMLYNGHLSEEITFGVAGKPAKWFNIAASYSLIENGKYSNIGAGLSFMPYDGINMTLAMDYIPLYYAQVMGLNVFPSRSKGLNVALGFSIVWGTNKKKAKEPEPEPQLEYKPSEETLLVE